MIKLIVFVNAWSGPFVTVNYNNLLIAVVLLVAVRALAFLLRYDYL